MSTDNKDSSGPETLNIDSLYLSDGESKTDWELYFSDINNELNCEKIVAYLKNNMIQEPQNLLTIDIIDYTIDNGCPQITNLIAQKNFLDSFLNLLKSETNAGLENQKKVIYLTQKWAQKFSNNNNYRVFQDNYDLLKNSGVCFPPDNFVMDTYNKYIGNKSTNQSNPVNQNKNNQQNGFNNNKQNNINNNQNNNNTCNNNNGNNNRGNNNYNENGSKK